MGQAWGYIISALVTGVFGVYIAWQNRRVHREVRTNHGKRLGDRVETMGDDIAQIKRTMVTQQDLAEHAAHDLKVAAELRRDGKETREILLAAIRVGGAN